MTFEPRWKSRRARLFARALGLNPDTGEALLQDKFRPQLAEKIERLLAMNVWQPIATAPQNGKSIRAYAKELEHEDFNPEGSVEACWCDDIGWLGAVWNPEQDVWDTKVIHPTHWMHHPQAPA